MKVLETIHCWQARLGSRSAYTTHVTVRKIKSQSLFKPRRWSRNFTISECKMSLLLPVWAKIQHYPIFLCSLTTSNALALKTKLTNRCIWLLWHPQASHQPRAGQGCVTCSPSHCRGWTACTGGGRPSTGWRKGLSVLPQHTRPWPAIPGNHILASCSSRLVLHQDPTSPGPSHHSIQISKPASQSSSRWPRYHPATTLAFFAACLNTKIFLL